MNRMFIVGNVVADPEFSGDGAHARASFSIASHHRYTNKAGERISETTFLDCVCWDDLARNAAASLRTGMRVQAHGRMEQSNYEIPDPNNAENTLKRSRLRVILDAVGPELRFHTAEVTAVPRAETVAI